MASTACADTLFLNHSHILSVSTRSHTVYLDIAWLGWLALDSIMTTVREV